jgi:transposase
MVGRYELSDAQWQRIADLLPGKPGDRGRSGADNRLFVNAVLWVLRSGAWWQDLPERYGKWKTVHKRFTRWAKPECGRRCSIRSLPIPTTSI